MTTGEPVHKWTIRSRKSETVVWESKEEKMISSKTEKWGKYWAKNLHQTHKAQIPKSSGKNWYDLNEQIL